ncbi:MAG: hypothetical protein ACR2PS_07970 [Pseudomonadales bacterium]
MTKTTMTRCYSLTMGTLNGTVTFFLFLMSRVNADAGWPNLLVSFVGPAATIAFLLITIAWFLDALRPGAMRAFVPGGQESPDSVFSSMCGRLEAPKPLPPSAGERLRATAVRAMTVPAYAAQRMIQNLRH